MTTFWLVAQIVLAVLITGAVLLQSQGGGLGAAWEVAVKPTIPDGVGKVVFYLTIVLVGLFTLVSVAVLASQ